MKTSAIRLFAVAAVMLALSDLSAAMTENKWVCGEASGNWSDPQNWSLEHVPTESEHAVFELGEADRTVCIDGTFTAGKFTLDTSDRTLTFTGGGSLTVKGTEEYFRGHVVQDGPDLDFSNAMIMSYKSVTVKSGSLVCNDFYRYSGGFPISVEGGSVTCRRYFRYYTYVVGTTALYVKGGSFSAAETIGGVHKTHGVHGKNVFRFEVSGGTATIGNLDLTVGAKIDLVQTGGELCLTDGELADFVDVSITGGTLRFAGDIVWPSDFYEKMCKEAGRRLDTSEATLCVPEGTFLSSSEPLTVKTVKSADGSPAYIDVDTLVFNGDIPFSAYSSTERTFHVYGPTEMRSTRNMEFAESGNNVYVNVHGAVTVDTRDMQDPSVVHDMFLSGFTSPEGEASLVVRGGGRFVLRPLYCWNPIKSVAVEDGADFGLANRNGDVVWGHLVCESFSLGKDSTLRITAGGNFVQASSWEIDPSAKIVVTVPETFTGGAFAILHDSDSRDLPAGLTDQVELVGAPDGMEIKCEHGQLTGFLRVDDVGKWGDYEWTGLGSTPNWSNADNWYCKVAPPEKMEMVFASSSVTNSLFDKFPPTGSTAARIVFQTNAVDSFAISGSQLTLSDAATSAVCSYSHVPQFVNCRVRTATGGGLSLQSLGGSPVIFGSLLDWNNNSPSTKLKIWGDIRIRGSAVVFPQLDLDHRTYPQSFVKLTVLPGAKFSVTNQSISIYGMEAGFRVSKDGELVFSAGESLKFQRLRSSCVQIIDGVMRIHSSFVGGSNQAFGGGGSLYITGGTRSASADTRVLFTNTLNVYPSSWTTVSADADFAMAVSVAGTPTLHVADGWTYGPAEGVETATAVGDRAMVVEGGATLTLEASGGTARFKDPFIGGVAASRMPATLAVTNGTLALDGSFETDVAVKTLADGVLKVEADQVIGGFDCEPGSSVEFAAGAELTVRGNVSLEDFSPVFPGSDQAGLWRTIMLVDSDADVKLPVEGSGYPFRYRKLQTDAGAVVQCRRDIGFILRFR